MANRPTRIAIRFLLRLAQILVGLFFATAAGTAFLAYGFIRDILPSPDLGLSAEGMIAALFGIFLSPFLIGSILVPAALVLAIMELMSWRGMLANLLAGAVVALFAGWSAFYDADTGISQGVVLVLCSAGFISGFVYWLISGRSAGYWMEAE